jgi:hypothetical protein
MAGLELWRRVRRALFVPREIARGLIAQPMLPSSPGPYSDDTAMAIAITEVREERGSRRTWRDSSGISGSGFQQPVSGRSPQRLPTRDAQPVVCVFQYAIIVETGVASPVQRRGLLWERGRDARRPARRLFRRRFPHSDYPAERSAALTHSYVEGIRGAIRRHSRRPGGRSRMHA